jgi:hypothetical protein
MRLSKRCEQKSPPLSLWISARNREGKTGRSAEDWYVAMKSASLRLSSFNCIFGTIWVSLHIDVSSTVSLGKPALGIDCELTRLVRFDFMGRLLSTWISAFL